MSGRRRANLAASVRQRLLDRARSEGRVYQELAQLYAMERFLFRLAASQVADRFVLKGGLMTLTWAGEHARVTRDIDLLGWGPSSTEQVAERIGQVLATAVPDDGVQFEAASIQAEEITVRAAYVGARIRFTGDLAGMVLRMQLDVGFGDAVVPPPEWIEYPELLDLGRPRVLGYPVETTIAEKLHAVCVLGLANSRMKDYYDLWTAHHRDVCDAERLAVAVAHTFERRDTEIPATLPAGLTDAFVALPDKQAQWRGFVRKSRLTAPTLEEAVRAGAALAEPAFRGARTA